MTFYLGSTAAQNIFLGANTAQQGGGAVSPVTPVTTWRIQPTALTVTGSTADAANQVALLASKANKDFPNIQVSGNSTCDIIMDLPEITAPGGLLFFAASTGSASARVASLAVSIDGGSTYTDVPFTPMQTQTTDNTDQLIDIPAGPARKFRFRYQTTTSAAHLFAFKVVQLQTDPLANDISVAVGMSITTGLYGGIVVRDLLNIYPDRDPIFLCTARSGAKSDTMLSEQLVKLIQPRAYIKRVFMDHGPNQYLGATQWANLSQGNKDAFLTAVQDVAAWFAANDRVPYYIGPTFINKDTFDAGAPTNVLQENVVDGPNVSIANQANGMRPYIMNLYATTARVISAIWNSDLDCYAFDGYATSILSWDFWKQLVSGMTPGDGVHPSGSAINLPAGMYRYPFLDAYSLTFTARPKPYLVRKIEAAEPFCSLPQKNRLYTALASLPDTANPTAIANRAALKARIDAIGTSYVEKSGQTSPSALPGIRAAYDFDDMNTFWSDDAGTIPAKDKELVRVVSDKSANAYKMINSSSAAAQPYVQPQAAMGEAVGQKALSFTGAQYLNAADAALYGSLDAAGTQFIVGWIDVHESKGVNPRILWQFLGTGGLNCRFAINSSKVQLLTASTLATEADDAPINVPHVYVLTYDGTTLKLRRNGVETISVAYAKPAWTATGLRLGATSNGFAGRRKSWNLITGAWTLATRDALEARLMAQAGS